MSLSGLAGIVLTFSVVVFASYRQGVADCRSNCRTAIVDVQPADGRVVKEVGSAVFSYHHEYVATLETRVRLAEKAGQFHVFHIDDAVEVGIRELYADLETLPGIETIHITPWKIHLEKTIAFSWDEVEPILAEIAERHEII